MFTLEEDEEEQGLVWLTLVSIAIVWFLSDQWPSLIKPFTFFEFWTLKGDFWAVVWSAWPLYLWGFALTVIAILRGANDENIHEEPISLFISGAWISAMAGIWEELYFRWVLFLFALITFPIVDWIFLGFMDVHIFRWLYSEILCPVANYMTLGYLEPYLMNGYSWVVGAAIISTNGQFRNGHSYQGWFGLVNSWFIGMYLHWVVFTHGILAAIFIHFLYDFIIFTLCAVVVGLSEKKRFYG